MIFRLPLKVLIAMAIAAILLAGYLSRLPDIPDFGRGMSYGLVIALLVIVVAKVVRNRNHG